MTDKGDFGGFKKGFFLDKKKDKSPESSKKPGQLSTGDQQLALMGKDPKKYHEGQSDQHGSSEADKGKLPDTGEGQIKNLSNEFRQLGGNTSLADAKIIGVGNNHMIEAHPRLIAGLINSVAKTGDVVLVEGVQAGRRIEKKDHETTKLLSKDVKVFGWDDAKLIEKISQNLKIVYRMDEEGQQAVNDRDAEKVRTLKEQRDKLDDETMDMMGRQRNEVLAKVLATAIKQLPDKTKIFVLAGPQHFTDGDPVLGEVLGAQKYIALEPTYTQPEEETKSKAKKYYTEA